MDGQLKQRIQCMLVYAGVGCCLRERLVFVDQYPENMIRPRLDIVRSPQPCDVLSGSLEHE